MSADKVIGTPTPAPERPFEFTGICAVCGELTVDHAATHLECRYRWRVTYTDGVETFVLFVHAYDRRRATVTAEAYLSEYQITAIEQVDLPEPRP